MVFPARQAGLEEVMKPPEHRAFLPSPAGSNFAAGGTLPVGSSNFVKAKYCQGRGLSWRQSHLGMAELRSTSSGWMAFRGSHR